MHYQKLIHEIAPDMNPAGIEAMIRIKYGNIDHLSREVFTAEVKIAAESGREYPRFLRLAAEGYGMGADFAAWEAKA